MAFNIINAKPSNKQVKWKFENTETIYISDVERFKRNVAFWQKKLNMDPNVQVELLEGAQWLQNHLAEEKNIVDVDHEVVDELEGVVEELLETKEISNDEPIIDSPIVEPSSDESSEQSSVSEDSTDLVDTPKRKSRKKAV